MTKNLPTPTITTDLSITDLATRRLDPSWTMPNLTGSERSLQRVRQYIGTYVCVHSAPSAWYGILVDASIDAGVISCDLADAGLWTQGMTKDLVLPGRKAREDLQARRDGVVTVTAITALQPSAYFSEGNDKIKDAVTLRGTRPIPPAQEGTSIEDFARFMDTTPEKAAAAILELYNVNPGGRKKDGEDLRLNFAGVLAYVGEYAKTKTFPIRGTAAIVLAGARLYQW